MRLKKHLPVFDIMAGVSLCALLLSTSALASPTMTHVTAACATSGSNATTGSITIAAGHAIAVGGNIRTSSSSDTVTVTDTAGDTFTLHKSPSAANSISAYVGIAKSPSGLSSGTVTLHTTGTWTVGCISVEDVTNYNTTSPEDTGVLATNSGTGTSPTVTSNAAAQAGDLLYSAFQSGSQSGFTESTSPAWTNTQPQAGNSNGLSNMGYIINAGTAGVARNGTFGSSATWNAIVMGIAPASAASAAPPQTIIGVGP